MDQMNLFSVTYSLLVNLSLIFPISYMGDGNYFIGFIEMIKW